MENCQEEKDFFPASIDELGQIYFIEYNVKSLLYLFSYSKKITENIYWTIESIQQIEIIVNDVLI